jgi:hypothetical protein
MPHDLVCFGVLMILAGFGDIYIIVANPAYRLPFFGIKPDGLPGLFFKAIQPFFHFGAGFGLIYGGKWAYPFIMAYSAYGLINAMANRLLLPGPHRIRTIFMIATVLVMVYLYCRRNQFKDRDKLTPS